MTALLAPLTTARRPTDPRPTLRPVRAPRRQLAKVPFMFVLAVVMALGMVGVLVLNTALQEQAFAVQKRQHEANELGYRLSDLEAQVTQTRSAANLAVRAQELGMKPNPYPALLRLPDGTIEGKPTQVLGGEVPSVRYRTPEEAAAQSEARDKAEAKAKADAAAKKKAAAAKKAAERAEAQAAAEAEGEAAGAAAGNTVTP